MLIAILSDIHGNLEAFMAVAADIDSRNPDLVLCLGDLIGYGPNPDEVVQLFQEKGYHCVLGNHEAALQNAKMRNWLNFQAKENSIQTEKLLSTNNREFCCSLPDSLTRENCHFVHGFPPSSVLQYVTMTSAQDLKKYFCSNATDLCFVGHSHDLLLVSWNGKQLAQKPLKQGTHIISPQNKYIINAGSVGQPRDGTNSAKYLLWQTDASLLEVVHIDYDIAATVKKIKERGFPESYGQRLW